MPIGKKHERRPAAGRRDIASSGRRSSRPHLPPHRYCTISSARPPTAEAPADDEAEQIRAQQVVRCRRGRRKPPGCQMTDRTANTAPTTKRPAPPAIDSRRGGQVGGQRICVMSVSHVVPDPYFLGSAARCLASGRAVPLSGSLIAGFRYFLLEPSGNIALTGSAARWTSQSAGRARAEQRLAEVPAARQYLSDSVPASPAEHRILSHSGSTAVRGYRPRPPSGQPA